MRLAVGEVVITKVEEGCLMLRLISFRRNSGSGWILRRHRHVFPSPRTWFRRTTCRAEQATNVFLLRLQTRTHIRNNGWLSVCRSRFSCFTPESITLLAPPLCCRGQTVAPAHPPRFNATEEADHHRLAAGTCAFSTLRATAGAGGFEISAIISVADRFPASRWRRASSGRRFSAQVAPAGADELRNAAAKFMKRTLSSWLPVPDAPTIPMLPHARRYQNRAPRR